MWSIGLVLLMVFSGLSDGIKCFKCDALESPISNCPGWHRNPVDSVRDLRDRGGLYTHCTDIRLANGTVVHQGPVPASPSCGEMFLHTWQETLQKRYKQKVRARCCEDNLCNGPFGAAQSAHSKTLNALIITFTLFHYYHY